MPPRGYVICSYPRSGSNYLCQLLASTGTLGRPQDWFNGEGIRNREDPAYPLAPREQLAQVLPRGSTANGVYGMKMFCAGFDALGGLDWAAALPSLHWVYLERLDLLGQAVSDVRSTQTQQYRSTGEARAEPRYDHHALRDSLARTARDHARWKLFFARNGIVPLHLTYEAVVADPQAAVDAIAQHVGVPGPSAVQAERVTLEVQRDPLSEQWRQRFTAREQGLSRLDSLPSSAGAWAMRQVARLQRRIHP